MTVVRLRPTQRGGRVPRALHLSSYLLSNGLPGLMALGGARSDSCPRPLLPITSPPPPSGSPQRRVHLRAQTATSAPAGALTMKRDPSQWSFVSSEKNKNTGCERSTGRQPSYCAGHDWFTGGERRKRRQAVSR